MKAHWFLITVITLVLAIFTAFLIAGIKSERRCQQDQKELCESYCNCIETQNCPYTFDYKDIKDCDCGDD